MDTVLRKNERVAKGMSAHRSAPGRPGAELLEAFSGTAREGGWD